MIFLKINIQIYSLKKWLLKNKHNIQEKLFVVAVWVHCFHGFFRKSWPWITIIVCLLHSICALGHQAYKDSIFPTEKKSETSLIYVS